MRRAQGLRNGWRIARETVCSFCWMLSVPGICCLLMTFTVADRECNHPRKMIKIVRKVLADMGGELVSSLTRSDTLLGPANVVLQDASKDAESKKELCALREALTARREALVERRMYMKYWLNRMTSGFTIPSSM